MLKHVLWSCSLVVVGCSPGSSTTGGTTRACTPGAQTACACGGAQEGFQVCNAEGTGLGTCQCGAGSSSSGPSLSSSRTGSSGLSGSSGTTSTSAGSSSARASSSSFSSSSSSSSSGALPTPRETVDRAAAGLCARRVNCGIIEANMMDACVASYRYTFEDYVTRPLTVGAVAFDAQAAATCLAWMEGYPYDCEDTDSFAVLRSVCDPDLVVPAAGSQGSTCDSYDCPDGLYCNGVTDACGTCQPYRAVGQPCSDAYDACPPEANCTYNSSAGRSECTARLPTGATCTDNYLCASRRCADVNGTLTCLNKDQLNDVCTPRSCEDPLFCGPVSGQLRCQARIATGSPCQPAAEEHPCADPFATCVGGVCTVVPTMSVAANGNCGGGAQCGFGYFCQGLGGQPGTCVPLVAANQACNGNGNAYGAFVCEPGTRCTGGTCQPRPRAGTVCIDNSGCGPGLYCGAGVCKAYRAPGAACSPQDQCVEGSVCIAGFCAAKKLPGASCSVGPECISGQCNTTCTGCY